MRSLFSGVSGLKVHQTKMDVIGNNIANVNTIGFKSSSVNFSDILYQTTQNATGANAATGSAGQNAKQIGLGTTVSGITTNISQAGGAQRTDIATDMMITGSSFFIVNSGGINYFTKSGAFKIDGVGNLATESGASVMGWQVDPADETNIITSAVSPLKIMSAENLYANPEATTKARITGNIDQTDTDLKTAAGKVTQFDFYDNLGNKYTAKLKVTQDTSATGASNKYNVSLTDIIDSEDNSIFVTKTVTGDNVTYSATNKLSKINFGGNDYTVAVDATTGAVTLSGTASPLVYDGATGSFKSIGADGAKAIDFTLEGSGENPFKKISLDFSSTTMYATSGSSSLQGYRGDANGNGSGKKVGSMVGVSIDTSGKIYGKYDNDTTKLLGQVAVASFANPAGLESVGNSMFAATKNSGDFDGIGEDVSSGGGEITTGVLEMSNVDLSTEFTQMITTQRGFQANSRIITTSDTLLEELINIKR